MFPHLIAIASALALLAGCGGPCTELDRLCDECPDADTITRCKYQVACQSDQLCDRDLQEAGDGCPFVHLPTWCGDQGPRSAE